MIIWTPSQKGHGGYTTSDSDRLDEIQRAQGHTSDPACVFETAFETFLIPSSLLQLYLAL